MPRVALGFRIHLGWAALVAVAGTRREVRVVERSRVELVDRAVPESFEPYHEAEALAAGGDLAAARDVVERGRRAVERVARQAVRTLVRGLSREGFDVVALAVLQGAGRPAPPLASTLRSHALVHTAEGELMRRCLARAGETAKLRVVTTPERSLDAAAREKLGLDPDAVVRRTAELGARLGAPWTRDQKQAALAAWLALATR